MVQQECLTNTQAGNVRHIEFSQGIVGKVYIKFVMKKVGLKAKFLGFYDKMWKWEFKWRKNQHLLPSNIPNIL